LSAIALLVVIIILLLESPKVHLDKYSARHALMWSNSGKRPDKQKQNVVVVVVICWYHHKSQKQYQRNYSTSNLLSTEVGE